MKKPVQVLMNVETKRRVEDAAARLHTSMAGFVLLAVDELLTKVEGTGINIAFNREDAGKSGINPGRQSIVSQ